ncbi:MAG TPA: hypothetical protein VNQ97_05750, partial [Burkholderiaceae bacterium]|nr:hypothetical protein [Burkholderiaceae bacterium]
MAEASTVLPALFRAPVVLVAALLGTAMPAMGQPTSAPSTVAPYTSPLPSTSHGIGLRFGYNDDYRKITLTYETPTIWSYQSQSGWGRLDLGAELGVAYWTAQSGDPDSMWQLSATPMLRW